MKKIFLLIAIISFCLTSTAQELTWHSYNEATLLQSKNSKKIFLLVHMNANHPGVKMFIEKIKNDKELLNYLEENYNLAIFDAFGNEDINYKEKIYVNNNLNKKGRCVKKNCSHDFAEQILAVRVSPSVYIIDNYSKVSEAFIAQNTSDLLKILKSIEKYEN